MNKRDDGGHAFPQDEPVSNELHPKYGTDRGMTLRDYFAAKAMQSSLLHPEANDSQFSEHAEWAYQMADAMIKERSK